MRFDDIDPYWQDFIGDHWDRDARTHWGDIENYIDTVQGDSTFLNMATDASVDSGIPIEDVLLPDSDFSLAYADWMQETNFDRDSWEYCVLLAEAGYFDSPEEAWAHYHED